MTYVLPVHVVVSPEMVEPGRLQELLDKLSGFSPVLEQVGGLLESGLRENFDTRGFGQWPALKASTLREKARRGYGGAPDLVRTGELREALTERGTKGHKFLVDENSVTVGVYDDQVRYAKWQAEGTKRGLPARVLIQVSPGTVDAIVGAITDWLGGGPGIRVFADAPVRN